MRAESHVPRNSAVRVCEPRSSSTTTDQVVPGSSLFLKSVGQENCSACFSPRRRLLRVPRPARPFTGFGDGRLLAGEGRRLLNGRAARPEFVLEQPVARQGEGDR